MASYFGNVTSWITGVPPDDTPAEEITVGKEEEKIETTEVTDTPAPSEDNEQAPAENPTLTSLQNSIADLDEIQEKAIQSAKEWGSYLLTIGKAASHQVAQTAVQMKNAVEEQTMLGDFAREQNKFVGEREEKKKRTEAGVPPWVGYNEEDSIKSLILALSSDKRNFLRNPPSGVQFNFDFEASSPVAKVMLQEDPKLKERRFEMVPKQMKEDIFWRNYFYRVSLIKQSAQLTSLAEQTGSTSENGKNAGGRNGSGVPEVTSVEESSEDKPDSEEPVKEEELHPGSPPENEFISDNFQDSPIDEEEMKKEMEQLGMTDDKLEDIPEWEKELQAELQEYEVVNDGSHLDEDDDELEEEILQQIEAESKQSS